MSETTDYLLTTEQLRACWAAILTNGRNCHSSPLLPNAQTAAADAVSLIQQHIDALQAFTTQQAWDMRSLELTVEKLRGEVGRYREALGVYAADENYGDENRPCYLDEDYGHIARAALEGGE